MARPSRAALVRDGRVVGFEEKRKPNSRSAGPGWVNAGAHVLNRNLQWPHGLAQKFSFETEVLMPEIARIAPTAFEVDGFFLDIGVPEDLGRAQKELAGW